MDPRPILEVALPQSCLLAGAQIQVTVMAGTAEPALRPPSAPNTSPCTLTWDRTLHDITKGPGLILHPNQHLSKLFPPEDKIVAPPHLRGFKKIIPLIITRVD